MSSTGTDWKWIIVAAVLLCASCSVMVVAWYMHLRFESWPLWQAILVSWCIALAEYGLQVPANRIGHTKGGLSTYNLRAIAEVAILAAFLVFNTTVLKEKLLWCHLVGFALVIVGVIIVLMGEKLGAAVY